jgi:ectoine hydroxylase-related dioxygenase (phytanoyl-CoA dioxygenase family)
MQSVLETPSTELPGGETRKPAQLPGKGYTLQPFLDAADVEALHRLHRETLPAATSEYYVTAFSKDVASKRRIRDGILQVVAGKLAQLAPGYRILNASFVTKKAGSTRGRLALHQDYSLVDHERDLGLNVWIPLCDVDARNGCMRMVDASSRFHHISATPPNPSPYDDLRAELEAHYLTDVPMPAGSAVLFDTRILHATEENRTDADRVAVFLNLVPAHATPRLHFWNPEDPGRLEIYEVDSEFMVNLPPNRYLAVEEKAAARFLGFMDYAPAKWSKAQLEAAFPRAAVASSPQAAALAGARKAAAWLVESQLPEGEFQTEFCVNRHIADDGQTVEELVFDSSPFVTSLVLYSLQFARDLAPGVDAATARGLQFLTSEMDEGGLWRYWTRRNSKRSIIPPDLDDTACISHLLQAHGVAIPDNKGLFYDSRDARGAFYTWLYKANSPRKWLLNLRTRGKAFSYTKELWQWTSGDDVCAVVNANVLMYLGETPGTRRTIEYLLKTLREGTEDKEIVFYAHRMSLYYFVSRACFTGVKALEPAKAILLERIKALEQADGSFGDELLTGLAICALLNLGAAVDPKAIACLAATQREDGSWRRVPMYGGPPTPTTFGSADLTTGICVEALARYASAGKAR